MSDLKEKIREMAQNNGSILEGMLLLANRIEELEERVNNPRIKTVFDPVPALTDLTNRIEKLEERYNENQ